MKVIGIGKQKTGTTTLGRAVEMLGFDKHPEWNVDRIVDYRAGKIEELLQFSEDYNNLEDNPWAWMYKELYERYQDEAMFVLTTRKCPEKWYESYCKQYLRTPKEIQEKLVNPLDDKEKYIAEYKQHNQDVRAFFKGKSNFIELCWEDGDGWEELCHFLGKEIPQEPFPISNSGQCKVSVIVPIYNAEKYIEQCAVSLFEQYLQKIEYIFVNDCSTDNSMQILEQVIERYPHRKIDIKIIHNKENKGSGYTRKIGLENATGEYTIQIDSDDWCEKHMLVELYEKAKATDADIVACGVVREYEDTQKIIEQKYSESREEIIKKTLSMGLLPSVWNKLIRRDLYDKSDILSLGELSYSEDKYLILRCIFVAKKIAYIPKPLYHYRQTNENSLCQKPQDRIWDDLLLYFQTTKEFLQNKGVWETYKEHLYIDIVSETITYSIKRSENIYENVKKITPKISRLQCVKYIWRNPYWIYKEKIIYSLILMKLEKLAIFVINTKKWLNKITK